MRTTATNRKLRLLLTGIKNKTLIPRPEFQRRLVWSNKNKIAFLQTVLEEYPFPEIYIAAGEVNAETGEGVEMLVDGQQRVDTLYQYFIGSTELRLGKVIPAYNQLAQEKKIAFLEYDVVIRDLGKMSIDEIKRVFQRINSTNYALNAMEIHNSRFEGEFKQFGEQIAGLTFFEKHAVFSANDVRRMQDLRFVLVFTTTIMSTYFNRDDELESYLERYNDEFDQKDSLESEITVVLDFIESLKFGHASRVWKKADLFTLLVESHRALIREKQSLVPDTVSAQLTALYEAVDNVDKAATWETDAITYSKLASAATNDRGNRLRRGKIIYQVIQRVVSQVLWSIEIRTIRIWYGSGTTTWRWCRSRIFETPMTTFCPICDKRLSWEYYAALG